MLDGPRDWPNWRNACVVRARTIAANLRLIEFAVEGALPAFGSNARTRVRAIDAGAVTAGSHICVNVGEGRMRVLVAAADSDPAARFMWSLIEGARVRLTVPAASAVHAVEPVRMVAGAGVRLRIAAADLPAARGLPERAANANALSRQNFLI
jgi:hypothetical protein